MRISDWSSDVCSSDLWLKVRSWPALASSSFIRAHMASRSWRNSRPRLAPLFGNEGAFMRGGILLAREIVVNATIVPATGLTIPPHPCSGFRSGNALQDQLQHELAAEERSEERRVGKEGGSTGKTGGA